MGLCELKTTSLKAGIVASHLLDVTGQGGCVDSNKPNSYRYQIGPGPELLQQIGQILVNHSECERAIFGIFKGVLNLSENDAYLLAKQNVLNAEKMANIILEERDRIQPSLLQAPLEEAIRLFRSSIQLRNEVAHWQWAVTDGQSGFASNSIKGKPSSTIQGKEYDLPQLRDGAWLLAKAATLLNQVAISMFARDVSMLSDPTWQPSGYRFDTSLNELMVNFALDQTREMLERIEAELHDSSLRPS